jgi:protein O-GlcNAc transferase
MPARQRTSAKSASSQKENNQEGENNTGLPWRRFALFAILIVLLGVVNITLPWLSQPVWASFKQSFEPYKAANGAEETQDAEGSIGSSDGFNPSFGIFPKGCKWREKAEPEPGKVIYDYWDFQDQFWLKQQPASCRVQSTPKPGPAGWHFNNNTPRTEVRPHESHVVYTNLWYNNGRWYALVDGPKTVNSWRFSRNQEITTLHVSDAAAFAETVDWQLVAGDTMLFDFIYFVHPTAIGHWWEIVGPLFSVLKKVDFKRPCDQFVLLHLKRTHLMEWVRAVLAVALGVPAKQALPTIVLQEETDNPFQQIGENLHPSLALHSKKAIIICNLTISS